MSSTVVDEDLSFWFITKPSKWSNFPEKLNVSILYSIENCPLSWSLKNAKYTIQNKETKYYDVVTEKQIIGTVIHKSIEYILKLFSSNGCKSRSDPIAISLLKEHGGYTHILKNMINIVINEHTDNPRFKNNHLVISNKLDDNLQNIRQVLQQLLARTKWVCNKKTKSNNKSYHKLPHDLTNGTYTEIKLSYDKLGWNGVVDQINIADDDVSIFEYKTGKYSEKHIFQVKVYNLLWDKDNIKNKSCRPVSNLILSYPDKDIKIKPLDNSEIELLEKELCNRAIKSKEQATSTPPPAYYNKSVCQFCSVRQLCEEYWEHIKNQTLENIVSQKFTDLEIKINSKYGDKSWNGYVRLSKMKSINKIKSILHISDSNLIAKRLLTNGAVIRLLNCVIGEYSPEDNILIITISNNTEIFVLDS